MQHMSYLLMNHMIFAPRSFFKVHSAIHLHFQILIKYYNYYKYNYKYKYDKLKDLYFNVLLLTVQ